MLTKPHPEGQVRQVYDALPNSTPAQARLAAMIAEAFINGMNANSIMTHDSTPEPRPQK